MLIKKTRRSNKAGFLQNTLKKTPSLVKSLISTYSISISVSLSLKEGVEVGVGSYLRLGTYFFFALRMGAYSRWALIRGWVLIRINTVITSCFVHYDIIYHHFPLNSQYLMMWVLTALLNLCLNMTPSVDPCHSVLTFHWLYIRQNTPLLAGPSGVHLRKSWLYKL